MELSDRIRMQERIVQVLAGALMSGVAILAGVAYFMATPSTAFPKMRSCSDTQPRSSCRRPCVKALVLWG